MLIRTELMNKIISCLTCFYNVISVKNKSNLTEENIHAETFFAALLNKLLDLELENANKEKSNQEGYDLIDRKNRCLAQVTATCTAEKLQKSLNANCMESFSGWRFLFVPIKEDAKSLRNKSYETNGLSFSPDKDIYDLSRILETLKSCNDIGKIREIYALICKEFPCFSSNGLDTQVKRLPFINQERTIYYISRHMMEQQSENNAALNNPEDISASTSTLKVGGFTVILGVVP